MPGSPQVGDAEALRDALRQQSPVSAAVHNPGNGHEILLVTQLHDE